MAGSRGRLIALACATLGVTLALAGAAGAANIGALQAKVSAGREEAGSLASQLQAAQGELAAAQEKAAAARAREDKLTGLLATGEERAARLSADVHRTQRHLASEKRRLHRARTALSQRLVAIYESGTPSTASVILASTSYDELTTRTEYLDRIEQSDSDLAARVAQVRHSVATALERVAALKDRVDAYNARLAAARSEIAGVRANAESAAAQLHSVTAARSAALATLKSKIGSWVSDIQAAEAAQPSRSRKHRGTLARRPLRDPRLHSHVRVRRQLLCSQRLKRSRRRLPDPPLDLAALRRPGRAPERPEARTGPHSRRNLGRLRLQRLGLRVDPH